MTRGAIDMCREFARLHIAHWRTSKAKGLPKSAARSRAIALSWLAAAKGRTQ